MPSTEIYTYVHTLSLHEALPSSSGSLYPTLTIRCGSLGNSVAPNLWVIDSAESPLGGVSSSFELEQAAANASNAPDVPIRNPRRVSRPASVDRKSTRLNSSH